MPETTEAVATAVIPAMRTNCTLFPSGAPITWVRPALIWVAPRPREVDTPKRVPTTARTSTNRPAVAQLR